jgi:hypothetical protein
VIVQLSLVLTETRITELLVVRVIQADVGSSSQSGSPATRENYERCPKLFRTQPPHYADVAPMPQMLSTSLPILSRPSLYKVCRRYNKGTCKSFASNGCAETPHSCIASERRWIEVAMLWKESDCGSWLLNRKAKMGRHRS